MKHRSTTFFFCLLFLASASYSQPVNFEEGVYNILDNSKLSVNELPTVDKLFETDEILHVQIATNMEKLILFKDDPDYQKAKFTITVADSMLVVKDIRIKVRGKTRVTICEDPPLKLDFKKTDFQWEWFDKLKSLKVVTPCEDPKIYTRYLKKEYFAYLGYSVLSDVSYKVRMIQLTISDTQGKVKPEVKYAYLIENDRKVAKRTNTKEVELKDTSTGTLIKQFYLEPNDQTLFNLNVLALYQYMIGNTDWTTNSMHNIKVFEEDGTLHPVPYDFDYSGLVNASYAIPNSSVPIENVTERHYLGPCSANGQFELAVAYIADKENEIKQTLLEDPFISKKSKEEMLSYMDEFFLMLKDPTKLEEIRSTNCSN